MQPYIAGQVLWGKVRFRDGEEPRYNRPYLIVDVQEETLKVLNVSSTDGKEWKLLLDSNLEINTYNPPLLKPSFVKLDSLSELKISDASSMGLMNDGKALAEVELLRIRQALKAFNEDTQEENSSQEGANHNEEKGTAEE